MKSFIHPLLLETACGHDGSEKTLTNLVKIASKAGAKQIKFQIFNLDERSLPNTIENKIFKPLVLSTKTWSKIIKFAKTKNLRVFADIYGDYSFKLAQKNSVYGYKIHSEDFFNSYFIEKVINTDRPVIINLGGTYKSEVYNLIKFLDSKNKLSKKIVLMHGVQTFPTPIKGHSLYDFKLLIDNYRKFNVSFGYADHIEQKNSMSTLIPISAYVLGADIIEKHFTDSIKYKRTDYQSALDSINLKKFINEFNLIKQNLEKKGKTRFFDNKYREMFKKTCLINKNKFKDDKININDVIFQKKKVKNSYLFSHNIIGKKLNSSILKNTLISNKIFYNKVGAIISVRSSSSRYPEKALKKINGINSIQIVIRRIKKIKNLNEIILATSSHKSDNVFEKIAKKEGIKIFRGSLNNLANRYYQCAKKFKLDYIVRVTGDALLCDELMLDKAILNHIKSGSDVTFIKNMPYGTAKEVISFNTLKIINETSSVKKNTEYLEFFLENKDYFKINYLKAKYKFSKNIRLTLDFPEDRLLFDKIHRYFNDKSCNFSLNDALKLLKRKPKWIKINNFIRPKLSKNEINTNLNI
tara:strand:+ start:2780 stop:4525 length:1746 start_codon:yes stop_codon:yes gene_type:complete